MGASGGFSFLNEPISAPTDRGSLIPTLTGGRNINQGAHTEHLIEPPSSGRDDFILTIILAEDSEVELLIDPITKSE